MKIYTRKGDDGTTGLLYGGRVAKSAPVIAANGSVDEAQALLGVVRAEAEPGSELDELLVVLEHDLYVLMAELATAPSNRHKLQAGRSLVTLEMIDALEQRIDELSARFPAVREFVIPGRNRIAAGLDVARTAVRRAERDVIDAQRDAALSGSFVGPYLNRLSDLVWTMARWQEDGESLPSRRATTPEQSRPGADREEPAP
jgi:cob(I)alamin adenosyltransferase